MKSTELLAAVSASKEVQGLNEFNRRATARLREEVAMSVWDAVVRAHPELRDPDVLAEFDRWVGELNRERFVLTTPDAADLYFSEVYRKSNST